MLPVVSGARSAGRGVGSGTFATTRAGAGGTSRRKARRASFTGRSDEKVTGGIAALRSSIAASRRGAVR